MKYIPFSSTLNVTRNIMVDSGRMDATVLELSHWPGNRTPRELKADTSAEIVINFLKSPLAREYLDTTQVVSVSNDHYDIDGLLSVWAILEPELALRYDRLIIDAATTGDFDVYTTDQAAQVCIVLDEFQSRCLQPFIASSSWSGEEVTAFIYRQLLGVLPCVLADVKRFAHIWQAPLQRVHHCRRLFEEKKVSVTLYPEIDLAVVRSTGKVHPYAIHENVDASRILLSYGNCHQVYYRYESFVEMASRSVIKRVSLDDLVLMLKKRERSAGEWFVESLYTAHPALRMYSGDKVPADSSLSFEEFSEVVVTYLRQARGKESAIDGERWENDTAVLPPSLASSRK